MWRCSRCAAAAAGSVHESARQLGEGWRMRVMMCEDYPKQLYLLMLSRLRRLIHLSDSNPLNQFTDSFSDSLFWVSTSAGRWRQWVVFVMMARSLIWFFKKTVRSLCCFPAQFLSYWKWDWFTCQNHLCDENEFTRFIRCRKKSLERKIERNIMMHWMQVKENDSFAWVLIWFSLILNRKCDPGPQNHHK